MKRFSFFLMTIAALVMTVVGCKQNNLDPDEPTGGAKVVGTFAQADIVAAASDLYSAWLEDSDNVPAAMTVGTTELTQPQYIYALAKAITNIQANKTEDVQVLSYKMADHPERDSYDQLEIAVFNGPKNGEETEDLGNVAARMIAAMAEKGQVPNQTIFTRGTTNIAFSTNRATICMLRALAEYKPQSTMPEKISTDYLSTSATIKGFATQFVKYLEVWENSVAEVLSADGSRNSGNGKPWENVHFIPIPYTGSAVNAEGTEQFDPKWQPYYQPEVAGVTYTAAQCWGIALKSLIDLCSLEGSTVWATERTPDVPAHTLGNGKSMNAPIPMLEEWFVWNQHPWYENENDGGPVKYNEQPITEVDIAFMMRVMPWHLTRSSQLGAIGNFQQFGTSKESSLVYDGYLGLICPMREFLIAARIFKYILDNDITENVYDAIKDQKFSFDLYGSEKPDIALDINSMNFTYEGGDQVVKVTTKDQAWTATVEGEGITVNPASGDAGVETEVTITAAANTLGSRSATVTFTTATGKSKTVAITQGAAPTSATIREFATEYVKIIDIWKQNTTTILDVENAHYVPEDTKITLDEIEYSLSDAVELASRSYLLLRGYDGNNTTSYGRNLPMPTIEQAYTMDSNLPETHSYIWGANPYAEPTNGGWFRMVTADGEELELVKIDLLDDYSQRHTNYPLRSDAGADALKISNFCQYTGNYLAGYQGCCCAKRIMLAYAYFFKYMLDNNLSDATGISADQTFAAPLLGEDEEAPTLKGWAQEFVKVLDVWQAHVGTVDADGKNNHTLGTQFDNVHFVPIGETKDNPYGTNNQYNPEYTVWTVEYAGQTYTSAQAWEISIRGLLNLVTAEGDAGLPLMDDRNKPWTFTNAIDFSKATIPSTSENCKWNTYPWYEGANTVKYNGEAITEVGLDFIIKCGSWHIVRGLIKTAGNASPLGAIGNYQEFGTTSGTLILDGYVGYIAPMRELLIVARIYDYMLKNGVDANVYDALKDQKFAFDLY